MPLKTIAQKNIEQTAETKSAKLINQSTGNILNYPIYSSSSVSNLIYVTDKEKNVNNSEVSLKSVHSELYGIDIYNESNTSFPLFFQNIDTVFIPKKAKRHLEKDVPKIYLKDIDSNIAVSIEKCLVQLSSLSSTIYSENRWKELSSLIMNEQAKKGKDNTRIYPKIINALKYSTDASEGVIQVKTNKLGNETYQEGITCKSFALTNTYYEAGLVKYIIKDKEILKKRMEFFYNQLRKAQDNVISSNLIGLYSKIELPTHHEMILEAKKMIKEKYENKKGKKLTFLNKHPKTYFKEASSRSFVEDNMRLFDYLTERGFMIPIIGDEKSGGRVVDSFTLMPSWIRKLVKIDGEPIVEVDFKALHPNIAMSVYGGTKRYMTHSMVAYESNINISDVKKEHLSFFNKTSRDMKLSKLYNYYQTSEPLMLKRIEDDKWSSAKKHKITSMKMFSLEVKIMTDCISQLNSMGIYVGYVYDALFCKEADAEIVKEIMDKVALENNVYTTAFINY